jgi:hypothetical protein
MNFKTTTVAAAVAMGLMCGTASAQITDSPNPNKAQNSEMRTQSGSYPYAVYPDGSPVSGTYMYSDGTYIYSTPSTSTYVVPGYVAPSDSTVWVVPAPTMSEPVAGRRSVYVPTVPVPNGLTNTPNPNRVQNNGVPTQYDTYYLWREDMYQPY